MTSKAEEFPFIVNVAVLFLKQGAKESGILPQARLTGPGEGSALFNGTHIGRDEGKVVIRFETLWWR